MFHNQIARSNSVRPERFRSTHFDLSMVLTLVLALATASAVSAAEDPEGAAPPETRIEVTAGSAAPLMLAQVGGDAGRSRPLEPTYLPREPEPKSWYNGSYIFALSRSVADSTIAPAGQVPLYVLTVPLDVAFLPFALIGGLFG